MNHNRICSQHQILPVEHQGTVNGQGAERWKADIQKDAHANRNRDVLVRSGVQSDQLLVGSGAGSQGFGIGAGASGPAWCGCSERPQATAMKTSVRSVKVRNEFTLQGPQPLGAIL